MVLSMSLFFSLLFFSSFLAQSPLFFSSHPVFASVLAWTDLRRKSSLASLEPTSHNQTLLQYQQKSSEAKIISAQWPRAHFPQAGVSDGLWQLQHSGSSTPGLEGAHEHPWEGKVTKRVAMLTLVTPTPVLHPSHPHPQFAPKSTAAKTLLSTYTLHFFLSQIQPSKIKQIQSYFKI